MFTSPTLFPPDSATPLRFSILLLVSCLLLTGCPSGTRITDRVPPANLPVDAAKLQEIPDLVVSPDCDVELPRESLVLVTWAKVQERGTAYRIDLTPYKQGFEQDLFYTLLPGEKKAFQFTAEQGRAANLTSSLADVRVRDFTTENRSGGNRLALAGLVPGMTYYLRVSTFSPTDDSWLPGQTIRFDAPVCPFDSPDR
ncbi:hypothetical protein CLV84_1133 [Neolewinella xylanilytica]|uniref:Uncharacterized protein n=2 Tax=Neolewinella xylanilytica TaxID=1514080 RepID=A0A2S6I9K2_9BACT|nr:hypothetical protein CLV84_1133 [Neolewinella xylanilytica]